MTVYRYTATGTAANGQTWKVSCFSAGAAWAAVIFAATKLL
jgi:hypothetical protein